MAALGLECIDLLCQADALDFFAAWRVVAERLPALPAPGGPLARAWVRALANCVRDAERFPEAAKQVRAPLRGSSAPTRASL